MIKTEYLGYNLDTIERSYQDGTWVAVYHGKNKVVTGVGHKIESACAAAQRKIKHANASVRGT